MRHSIVDGGTRSTVVCNAIAAIVVYYCYQYDAGGILFLSELNKSNGGALVFETEAQAIKWIYYFKARYSHSIGIVRLNAREIDQWSKSNLFNYLYTVLGDGPTPAYRRRPI
jgi:hypothetical protein